MSDLPRILPGTLDHADLEAFYAELVGASPTSRKCIADYYRPDGIAVNVKTKNLGRNCFSPNMVAARRLWRFLQDGTARLHLLFIEYRHGEGFTRVYSEREVPIESISWDCLAIRALGCGMIQQHGELVIKPQTREAWLREFQQAYLVYLDKEADKQQKLRRMITRRRQLSLGLE